MKPLLCIWVVVWISWGLHLPVIAQAPANQSDFLFEHFDTKDGLPSNFANAVVQDSIGFLWFLHDNALSRYDGYHFKIYLRDSAQQLRLSSNTREGMLVLDNAGSVCVINQQSRESNKKLSIHRYDRPTDSFQTYFPNVEKASVTCATFDSRSSVLYLGSFERGLFVYDWKSGETNNYINNYKGSHTDPENTILAIHDQDTVLILGTQAGLWTFNKETKTFKRPACSCRDTQLFYDSTIVFLLKENQNTDHLWLVMIGNKHHLIKVDKTFNVLHHETHSPLDGEVMIPDQEGYLWFTTNTHGLYKYNPRDSLLSQIRYHPKEQYSLRSNFLRGIAIDRNNNIWITTTDRGISRLRKRHPQFFNVSIDGEVTARLTHTAGHIDYLFVSRSPTSGFGQNEILITPMMRDSLSKVRFEKVPVKERISGPPDPAQALSTRGNNLFLGRNFLWMGSWHEGIIGVPLSPSGMPRAGLLKRLEPDPANPTNTISGWSTTGLWEDGNGNLWVGTRAAGLNKVNLNIPYGEEGSVVHYRHIPGDSTSISNDMVWWTFHPKDEKSFWVITATGIDLFSEGIFQTFFKAENAMTMQKDSEGTLLIGTSTGLLKAVEPFNDVKTISAIPLDNFGVFGMAEDHLGRLWVINNEGLVFYDRKQNSTIVFSASDDLAYSGDWIGMTSQGLLITSDAHGFTVSDPLTFQPERKVPKVVFTNLFIKNKPVDIRAREGSEKFTIARDINMLDELLIDHRNNYFSIEFSALEFTSPDKNRYRYKMEGYDEEWIETDSKTRIATYTNMDAGKYIFKVKASNHHGIWNNTETTLAVVILPPPWKNVVGVFTLCNSFSCHTLDMAQI